MGAACIAGSQAAVAQSASVQWSGVERTIVFADVHGAATELRERCAKRVWWMPRDTGLPARLTW